MQLNTTLRCSLSGLVVGSLLVETTAGALPYISTWDKLIVRHPVFSLGDYKLFEFARKEWKRLAKKAADDEITEAESNILRVTYLAVLHSLGSIKQERPVLPPLAIVQSTLNQALSLAYWKYHLDSPRFRFPQYSICNNNTNLELENIREYLDLCFQCKEDYETKVNNIAEEAKLRAAQAAMEALTREWIAPVSRKVLWAWVKHYLPSRYDADKVGWMHTLFLGGGNAILEFQEEDIEMMEHIIIGECPQGTGVMKAVRERIDQIWKIWRDHYQAFEVDLADYAVNQGVLVNGAPIAMPDPGPEPQMKDFAGNKARYFIAAAKWKIAFAAWDAQQNKNREVVNNPQLGEL